MFELVIQENDYEASYELEAAETTKQMCNVVDTLVEDHSTLDNRVDAASDAFTAWVESSDAGVLGTDFQTPGRH